MRLFSLLLLGVSSLHAATWLVPSVQPGTEIRITNREAASAAITFELIPIDGSPRPEAGSWTLSPGESRVFRNPLAEVLQTESTGTLRISSSAALILSAKGLPVVDESTLADAGTASHVTWLGGGGDSVSSAIGLALLEPGTEVEVVVYGADGVRTGSKVVSGGQATVTIPLPELMPDGAGVARATIRVRSGKAMSYGTMVDAGSGDTMVFPAALRNVSASVAWLPAFRRGELRTSLRAVNVNAPGQLSVLLVYHGVLKGYVVAAGKTLSLDDVLGTAFGITDDAAGLVKVTTAMLVTAAQVQPASLQAQALLNDASLIGADQTGVLTGVQADAKVVLSAGSAGAQVSFRLLDASGAELAVAAQPLDLVANEYREIAWSDLFAAVPEGAQLELSVVSGSVAAAEVAGSSARWVEPVAPGACTPPDISELRSVPDRLPTAGEVSVSWSTGDAAQVSFSPALSTGALNGAASVRLTETTRILMTAANACGSTSRDLLVAVGVPGISRVTRISGAATIPQDEGEPGQMLRIGFDNLDNGADVEMVIFKGPKGDEYVANIDGATVAGELQVQVPLPSMSSAADAYQPGAYQIFVSIRGVRTAKGWPFTIRPLTLPADPVAVFQAWVNSLTALRRASVDRQRDVPDMAVLGDWQTATAGNNETILQNLARDLALSDTARMPLAPTLAGLAAPGSGTISRRAVGILMAYNQNLIEAQSASVIPLPDGASAFSSKRQTDRSAGSCLVTKMPALPICIAHAMFRRTVAPITDSLEGLLDFVGPVAEWAGKLTPAAVITIAKNVLDSVDIACQVLPTQLVGFAATKKLDYRPSRTIKTGNRVKVEAIFHPWESKDAIAKKIVNVVVEKVAKKRIAVKEESQAIALEAGKNLLKPILDYVENSVKVGVALLKLQDVPEVRQQVGNCDLRAVWAQGNVPLTDVYRGGPIERALFTSGNAQGEDDYFYIGRKVRQTKLCVTPEPDHFYFRDNFRTYVSKNQRNLCRQYGAGSAGAAKSGVRAAEDPPSDGLELTTSGDIDVGPPDEPKLTIQFEASAVMRLAGDGVQSTFPNFEVRDGSPYLNVLAAPVGLLIHNVEKIGKYKWKIFLYAMASPEYATSNGFGTGSRSGLGLVFDRPLSFSDRATVKMTTSYSGQAPNTVYLQFNPPGLAGLNFSNIGHETPTQNGGGSATVAVLDVTPLSFNFGATALSVCCDPNATTIATTQITVVVEYVDPEAP